MPSPTRQELASRLDQACAERGDRESRGAVAELRGAAPNHSENLQRRADADGTPGGLNNSHRPRGQHPKTQTSTSAAQLPAAADR